MSPVRAPVCRRAASIILSVAGCAPSPAAPGAAVPIEAPTELDTPPPDVSLPDMDTGGDGPAPSVGDPASFLPSDAAVYLRVRLDVIDAALLTLPSALREDALSGLRDLTGTDAVSTASLAERLGLDPSRTVHFSFGGGPADEAERILEAAADEPDDRAKHFRQFGALEAPLASGRIIIPAAPGRASELRSKLLDVAGVDGERRDCRIHRRGWCAPFEDVDVPPVVALSGNSKVAAYAYNDAVVIDVVPDTLTATDDAHAKWLAARHRRRGGPATHAADSMRAACARASASSNLISGCIDADAAANAGRGQGYEMVAWAVTGAGLDPDQISGILKEGLAEANMNRRLARLKRVEIDGLSFSVRMPGEPDTPPVLEGRWEMVDETAKRALRQAFANKVCATTPAELRSRLLSPLSRALPAGMAELGSAQDARETLQLAGYGGLLVAGARSWPAILPWMLAPKSSWPTTLPRVCVQANDQLSVSVDLDPAVLQKP